MHGLSAAHRHCERPEAARNSRFGAPSARPGVFRSILVAMFTRTLQMRTRAALLGRCEATAVAAMRLLAWIQCAERCVLSSNNFWDLIAQDDMKSLKNVLQCFSSVIQSLMQAAKGTSSITQDLSRKNSF